jgi:diguanylate cyclase (GGDEF)-like protein
MNPQSILLMVLVLILIPLSALLNRPQSRRLASVSGDGSKGMSKRDVSGGASAPFQPRKSADVVAATEPRFEATTAANHALHLPGPSGFSGPDAEVSSPVPPPQPGSRPDIPPEDWDVMFSAITARLRNAVDRRLATAPDPQRPEAAARLQGTVLECLGALDQLHAALATERSRQRQLEPTFCAPATATRPRARGTPACPQVAERRDRHTAMHDGLTRLPNFCRFRERLDHALANSGPQPQALAVLCLDLDGFGAVNARHGHAAGDEVIRAVAGRLTRAIGGDDMVARVGRDAFACLLRGRSSREELSEVACMFFDVISAPIRVGVLDLTVCPNIGISALPTDGASCRSETWLENAVCAMVQAKLHCSGYAFSDPAGRASERECG